MSEIRLAIIGAGIIAGAHLSAAEQSKRVTVTAVVDPCLDRAEALAKRAHAPCFASLDELLADGKTRAMLDAVVICTPPSVRLGPVQTALAAGIPVLVEKPLAHCVTDAQALVALASQYPHTPTAVAFCHRYAPGHTPDEAHAAQGRSGHADPL